MANRWLSEDPSRNQADIAAVAHVSQSTVSKWINYRRRPTARALIEALSELFERTFDEVSGAIKRTPVIPSSPSTTAQLAEAKAEIERLRADVNRLERLQGDR